METSKSNLISKIVADIFYERNIRHACLASSMITKILIEKYTLITPELIKGYAKIDDKYWGHFWLKYDSTIIDTGTKIWLLSIPVKNREEMQNKRVLSVIKPSGICLDKDDFDLIQTNSYKKCLDGLFWDDIETVSGPTIRFVFEDLLTDVIEPIIHKLLI